MKIGNTSFGQDTIDALQGKTAEEILAVRPNWHIRVAEKFAEMYPAKKVKKSRPKKEEDKPTEND